MDVNTSRVEYRSSLFIKTVFEATFSFFNILRKIVRTRFLQCFFFTLTKQCIVSRFQFIKDPAYHCSCATTGACKRPNSESTFQFGFPALDKRVAR